MESKEEVEINSKIPKERRKRTKETEGKFDNDGFFRTPNGSFWDMDGEYFNHYGYDIHGGKYLDGLDYIPGPSWIEELGCYPEDEEKYKKEDIDEDINEKDLDILEGEGEVEEIDINNFEKLGINEEDMKEGFKNDINNKKENKKDKKNKNKNKKKKKKEEGFDEDEWEEIED